MGTFWVKLSMVAGMIALFILYRRLTRPDDEFIKEYNKVLLDKEYKVKGQYDDE